MSVVVLYQGTITRKYLRNKTKDDVIDLMMGTLSELDVANKKICDLVRMLREGEGVRYDIGERMEAYIVGAESHLRAYGIDPENVQSVTPPITLEEGRKNA